MEQQLSDSMKAILVKIALELKKMGWKSNSQTNEIDVFQGHLGMYKELVWEGDVDLPDINVDVNIDMGFSLIEEGEYFLVLNEEYSLFAEGVGSSQKVNESDLDVSFSERDVSNQLEIQNAAKKINVNVLERVDKYGYEYSQESSQDWKHYHNSGEADADYDRDY